MWPRQSKHLKARDQNQKVERHLCFQRQGPVKHFIRRKSEEQEGDPISACGFLRLSFQEWMFTVDVGLNTFANLKLFSNIESALSSLFGYPARTSTLPPNACARMRAHVHLILESWAWKERASWRQVSVPKIRGFRVSSPESSFVWSDQRRWLTARSTAGPLLLRDSFASLPNVLETLESSLPDLRCWNLLLLWSHPLILKALKYLLSAVGLNLRICSHSSSRKASLGRPLKHHRPCRVFAHTLRHL